MPVSGAGRNARGTEMERSVGWLRSLAAIISRAAVVRCTAPAPAPVGATASAPVEGAPKAPPHPPPHPPPKAPPRRVLIMVQMREPTSLEPNLQPQDREWSALGSGLRASFQPEQAGPVPCLAARRESRPYTRAQGLNFSLGRRSCDGVGCEFSCHW
jgi:hypothetical protein